MGEQENRVEVEIYGDVYVLKGNETTEYMQDVADYVNKMMKEIATRNFKLPLNKVAILSAINIVDELFKLREEYDNLVKEYEQLIEEIEESEPKKHKKRVRK
ncbi:cell division protein ZapA [Desulfolucanica intricata]|uniref:cell division protein ZapA n=1 Tax=Desulfolucanica intricata TaxID=1285191 RepID=UPI0009ECE599|nr:cell division protein ZapA [Desulfolucanica intricata]